MEIRETLPPPPRPPAWVRRKPGASQKVSPVSLAFTVTCNVQKMEIQPHASVLW